MSKLTNPKAWYLVGIGAAALTLDVARRWIKKRQQEAKSPVNTPIPMRTAPEKIQDKLLAPAAKPAVTRAPEIAIPKPDDLTEIKGIGPTFARRLAEAGITTFAAVAAASPDYLREVTKATAVANPDEWITQARALA